MGIIQRQSISGIIYTFIGAVLGFFATGIIQPRIFQAEEIGLLRILVSYATVLSTFAVLGFSIVTVKMFPLFRDPRSKHHGFFGLGLLVGFVGFIFATLIYLSFQDLILERGAEKSPLFAQFFYLVIPITFFLMLYSVVDTYFRVLYQATIGIVYREIVQRIMILAVFVLFYFKVLDFTENVYFYGLAFSIPAVLMMITLAFKENYSLIPDFAFLKKPLLKKIGHVGLFGIFSSLSGILVINIDILMLNHLEGLAQTGFYTITFFFGALVLLPSRPLIKISSVIIADAFERNDLKEVQTIYKKSSINLGLIGLLIFIGLWVNIDNIFHVIGEDFRVGQWVILFIGFANLLDMLMGISNQIFFNSKYYTTSAYLNFFFMLLLVITNLLLIPLYGIVGAAVATLLSKFIYNLFKYVFLLKKLKLQPFSRKTLVLLGIGLTTVFLIQLLPTLPNFIIDIAVRSTIISILFSTAVYFFKLSDDLNLWIDKIWGIVWGK